MKHNFATIISHCDLLSIPHYQIDDKTTVANRADITINPSDATWITTTTRH